MAQLLNTLSERFRDAATVRVVFGDPIETQGKTLIPVARVAFGLGGGSAPGRRRRSAADPAREGAPEQGDPAEHAEEAEGGGGGVMATPVGVVEVTAESTRFVSFAAEKKLAALLAAGAVVGFLLGRRAGRR